MAGAAGGKNPFIYRNEPSRVSNEREISVRYHLCEASEGPVPGKWYRTLISRSILADSAAIGSRMPENGSINTKLNASS